MVKAKNILFGKSSPKGKIVEFNGRTLNVFKDYQNETITVLENNEEIWHGGAGEFHKWIRKEKHPERYN